MDNREQKGISEQDLVAIRKMRAFRRALSMIVAVLILVAAILLALLSGVRGDLPPPRSPQARSFGQDNPKLLLSLDRGCPPSLG